ncbi:MAG: RNA polymerase sigma factor [Gammaproteobacteria bacterium]|nr:RNA polymerase sigma factor [Gammaproteobacteria bacterium]
MSTNTKNDRPDNDHLTEEPITFADPIDLGRLYVEIRASLLRYTARYFRRSQEAEDVVQEVFVKVIAAQRKREISSPKAYLFQTARNISLKQLNKPSYKLTDVMGDILPESDLLTSRELEEEFESSENFELFCRAVRDLPVKCRRAFVLCRIYGYSHKEVAAHMDISLKAVEGHLARALRRCMSFMEAEERRSGNFSKEKKHG